MVSLTSPDGRPVTQIRRMPTHGTDIYLLEKYNGPVPPPVPGDPRL